MRPPQRSLLRRHGFTLVELIVVIVVIAILAAILIPVLGIVKRRGNQTAGLSNMRQVGSVVLLYAADHDYELPGRATGEEGSDRWPKLLSVYVKDIKVYAAPGDPANYIARNADPLSNEANNTSYIMNGYNDVGMLKDPTIKVRMNQILTPSTTLLFGMPIGGSEHFYMDMEEGKGNQREVLNLKAYGDGSNYLFADGSARFITEKEYTAPDSAQPTQRFGDRMWLVNKDYVIPQL